MIPIEEQALKLRTRRDFPRVTGGRGLRSEARAFLNLEVPLRRVERFPQDPEPGTMCRARHDFQGGPDGGTPRNGVRRRPPDCSGAKAGREMKAGSRRPAQVPLRDPAAGLRIADRLSIRIGKTVSGFGPVSRSECEFGL